MRRPLNAAPRCKKPAPYNPELPALSLPRRHSRVPLSMTTGLSCRSGCRQRGNLSEMPPPRRKYPCMRFQVLSYSNRKERRHADTAGDEHKPLTLVARKREVTRDAPRKYGTSGYKVGKCLFECARLFIEFNAETHVGLRRRRRESKVPSVASRVRYIGRKRPFGVLAGQEFRLPSRKNQFVCAFRNLLLFL